MLRNSLIFLASFFITMAVFVWSENEISPSFQSCISQHSGDHGDKKSQNKSLIVSVVKSQAICSLRLVDRHNGFFAALAAMVVAAFTGTLWFATDKLWKSGQATFEASQRAFVFLDGFDFELTPADNRVADADLPPWYRGHKHLFMTYFALRPRWKNAGETQTRKMFVQVDWRGPPGPIPPIYEYRKPPEPMFLAPKAVEGTPFFEAPTARTLVDYGLRPLGVPPCVFIWGRADYKDVFGKPHFIEWCHKLRLEAHDGKLRASTFQWGDYNRSD
jgi:hypothetical protein